MIRHGRKTLGSLLLLSMMLSFGGAARSENWPGWRGPRQDGVSLESALPVVWSQQRGIHWHVAVRGEGPSSPIVWDNRVFLTAAEEFGERRWLHCFDRTNGETLWSRSIEDASPEISSALTGHAAATPITDGQHVYVFFGNAGAACYDMQGNQRWQRSLGAFETELGLATSPVLHDELVLLVCDHDGDRFRSFDSFVIALDKHTGETRWRTERPGLFRSWSTPLVVPTATGHQLVVAGQDQLRGYDVATGGQLWSCDVTTGWVAPSPLYADGRIYVASGRAGPLVALRAAAKDEDQRLVWRVDSVGPYVCSPLLYDGRLLVHNEQGVLHCFAADDGRLLYKSRLDGRFYSSAVAGDGKIYLTNLDGTTYVLRAADELEVLHTNTLNDECLATPAISAGTLFLRSRRQLYAIGEKP